jgi:hypothetical protein
LNPSPFAPRLPNQQTLDVLVGFAGWFIINGLVWLAIAGNGSILKGSAIYANFLLLPINLIVLIVIAVKRRMIAFGMLLALALNLAVSLLMSLSFNAWCFIPFFIK